MLQLKIKNGRLDKRTGNTTTWYVKKSTFNIKTQVG